MHDSVCLSVYVLDSSKCHGISYGIASQHLMSVPLFPELSGQRNAHTHTHTHKLKVACIMHRIIATTDTLNHSVTLKCV